MEKGKELTNKEIEAKALKDALNNFYNAKKNNPNSNITGGYEFDKDNQKEDSNNEVKSSGINQMNFDQQPKQDFDPSNFQEKMGRETDPDLMITYERVKLPSKGIFYNNDLKEVDIEYLTSKDEDLLTTPSWIEDGSVLSRLLKRKIVTKGVNPDDLLKGDRSAIILFLRTSSYGYNYEVNVPDPRTRKSFPYTVDLSKLKYKEITEKPDSNLEFSVDIPMRKKTVKFRLLTSGEEEIVRKNAQAYQEAYNLEYSEYRTTLLKSQIKEINGIRDRNYIDKFVDAMPAGDTGVIRRKILDVTPEVDMMYEFTAPDGYEFKAPLSLGLDFFFPKI